MNFLFLKITIILFNLETSTDEHNYNNISCKDYKEKPQEEEGQQPQQNQPQHQQQRQWKEDLSIDFIQWVPGS